MAAKPNGQSNRWVAIVVAVVVVVLLVVAVCVSLGGGGGSDEEGVRVAMMTTAQKDQRRVEDLKKMLVKVGEYQANNGGSLPGDLAGWRAFIGKYLPDWRDPDRVVYELVQACDYNTQFCVMPDALGWEANKRQIYVAWHAACANGALAGYQKDDAVVAYMALEEARPACVDK